MIQGKQMEQMNEFVYLGSLEEMENVWKISKEGWKREQGGATFHTICERTNEVDDVGIKYACMEANVRYGRRENGRDFEKGYVKRTEDLN